VLVGQLASAAPSTKAANYY